MESGCHADETASWVVPPAKPRLEAGEVHVWRAELDRSPFEVQALDGALSPEERKRAERFRFDRDRVRFICARGVLRSILSLYLGVPPESLAIEYGRHGKPFLGGQREPGALQFNLSHSAGLAAVALARGKDIGVDIERVNPELEIDRIASQYFEPAEVLALERLPGPMRVPAFFALWTRKEALLKALGEGLGWDLDLQGFEVPLDGDGVVRQTGAVDRWYVRALPPIAGYAGAIVVPGDRSPALHCFVFQ
jgi:4'-phosphopantetheinyl transferase